VAHAQVFDPQRWLGAAADAPKRVSLPFDAGPCVCPGRYIAGVEINLAMAVLLSRFDIAHVGTAHGQPPAERMAFTVMPLRLLIRLLMRLLIRLFMRLDMRPAA